MSTRAIKLRHKNQMTLPVKVSEDLGIREGDTIFLQRSGEKYCLVTAENMVDPTAGALAQYTAGKQVTLEDMDKAVEEGILENWNRFVRETEAEYDK